MRKVGGPADLFRYCLAFVRFKLTSFVKFIQKSGRFGFVCNFSVTLSGQMGCLVSVTSPVVCRAGLKAACFLI